MNSTTSNFDIYSTFTYDDAKKYFESTSINCKSDNDCLERSSCIGNKCITTFYCKENDNSVCSLYTNFCDGKSCYKSDEKCDKNDNCLSGQCDNNKCISELYSYETHTFNNLVREYSLNSFTFEDAKNYYKKLNVTCEDNKNCPNHTYCSKDCLNCSGNCVSQFYCKKDKSICSFNYDEKNEIRFSSKISSSENVFGLEDYEKCRYDNECIGNRCDRKYFFGIGECRELLGSDHDGIFLVFFFIVSIVIEGIIVFIICVKLFEKFRAKRKGLIKETKIPKGLIISGTIIGILLLIIFVTIEQYYSNLNKEPL